MHGILDDERRRRYLAAMGIECWVRRERASGTTPARAVESPAPVVETPEPTTAPPPFAPAQTAETEAAWRALQDEVAQCTRCALHRGRTQTVFGTGDRRAHWLFVGEAPGAEEDRQGEPFVGRAGQLLNAMIKAIGLRREQVYIANLLKCRPPNNRDPQPDEVEHCEPFLVRQIELIAPRLIVALGRHAAHSLLRTELALGKLRGRVLAYRGTPLVVTYHPAYLLRNPADKRKAWDDLCLARVTAGRNRPE